VPSKEKARAKIPIRGFSFKNLLADKPIAFEHPSQKPAFAVRLASRNLTSRLETSECCSLSILRISVAHGTAVGGGAVEDQWLRWAKRLHAIASTGLHFCKDDFDRERYQEVATIAQSMLALIGNIPIKRIEGLLSDFAKGYATPKIDVRGAVIEDGRVLLVRERSDGLWTLPGGFADVGLSATENVIKEIQEEAGIRTSVTRLYSVRHKAKQNYDPDIRDFYKMFFLCRRVDEERPRPGLEVLDAAFFPRDSLPQLSRGRVIEGDIEAAFAFHESPDRTVILD
jgi:ADP-ribose pyrophosphatase YjhB (NUDIX family)